MHLQRHGMAHGSFHAVSRHASNQNPSIIGCKPERFKRTFDEKRNNLFTPKKLINYFTLFFFAVLVSHNMPIAHASETVYPCLDDVSQACLYSAMKTSDNPKIKVNTNAFCFIFVLMKEETLTDEIPWQAFERLHRKELTNNPNYLKGHPASFKKNYIDQSLKALHQIAKEECPDFATKT